MPLRRTNCRALVRSKPESESSTGHSTFEEDLCRRIQDWRTWRAPNRSRPWKSRSSARSSPSGCGTSRDCSPRRSGITAYRAKYRGRAKVQFQAYLSAIAQNLKRLLFLHYQILAAWSLSQRVRANSTREQYSIVSRTFSTRPVVKRKWEQQKWETVQPVMQSDSPRTSGPPWPSRGRHERVRSIHLGNRRPSSSDCRSACRSWPLRENEAQPPPDRP
jgi:hypothetical protein